MLSMVLKPYNNTYNTSNEVSTQAHGKLKCVRGIWGWSRDLQTHRTLVRGRPFNF